MVSKETLILIAVLIILVIAFMYWANANSEMIQGAIDVYLEELIKP